MPGMEDVTALAKVIYIECFELQYNGFNNGDLRLSQRQVSEPLGCTQRTAAKMLGLLQKHGFIRPNVKGRFYVKTRAATTCILTRYEWQNQKATLDFAKFKQRMPSEHQTVALRASEVLTATNPLPPEHQFRPFFQTCPRMPSEHQV